jgi:stage II sporulation protein D
MDANAVSEPDARSADPVADVEAVPSGGREAAHVEAGYGGAERTVWPERNLAAGGSVLRVGLGHDVGEAVISGRGSFTVTVYAESTRRISSAQGVEWLFRAEGNGFQMVGPEESIVLRGTVRLTPDGEGAMIHDGVAYRGEIEVFISSSGGLSVVNVIDLESYLRGVVPKEIGPRSNRELEAVKAQAVAARTYVLARGGGRERGDFDLHSTIADQAYGGRDAEDPTSDRAILETAGLVAFHGGQPIDAYFSSCCGGRTEARQEVWGLDPVPYLISVLDTPGGMADLDRAYCNESRNFKWSAEWDGDEILNVVRRYLPDVASTPVRGSIGEVRDLTITDRAPSGRIKWLRVETDIGDYRVHGDRVRRLLRRPGSDSILWSSWFDLDVSLRGGRVARAQAKGRGYGHGVGMCQHGALGMARRGFSYEQILKHYYPGIRIATPSGYWD